MSEPNEIIKQLRERKSVRIFDERIVPQSVKNELISSAFEAPTAGNMMLLHHHRCHRSGSQKSAVSTLRSSALYRKGSGRFDFFG